MTDRLPVSNRKSRSDRVERGVYAQGWYAESHCYHPSLPPRRLRMVDQFAAYRATMLTWPMLGGGGISLPYLEEEAHASVPARYRFYGYVNDGDFAAACAERGIKPFSVIFCMQGWEFPAELSEAEDEVLALNELRGAGDRAWLGLREFTQDRYPKLWRSVEDYFPDGLRNHRGEQVTDLWEECCSRDIDGRPLRAHWLECGDRDHICHYMDLNNPVWLEYLKAVIRIHVDAGVAGIQFDEPSSPISALQYGGCFCDVCMEGFTGHLQQLPPEELPPWVREVLPGFHYGRWLRDQGKDRIDADDRDYLSDAYAGYLRGTAARSFLVLTSYAREYAASQGREILLSANLYDGLPVFDPHVAMLDVAVPEQRTTLFKQPGWMRYMAGFASGKPMVINVNPYGGVLPELGPGPGPRQGARPRPDDALRGDRPGCEPRRAVRGLDGQHHRGRAVRPAPARVRGAGLHRGARGPARGRQPERHRGRVQRGEQLLRDQLAGHDRGRPQPGQPRPGQRPRRGLLPVRRRAGGGPPALRRAGLPRRGAP